MRVGIARIVDSQQTGRAFIMPAWFLNAMDGLARMSLIVPFAGHVKSNTGINTERTQNDHPTRWNRLHAYTLSSAANCASEYFRILNETRED